LAVDDYVRKKPVSVRRDTMEEVLETENSKPLYLSELRSVINGSTIERSTNPRGKLRIP
jgi:hypothetical protein